MRCKEVKNPAEALAYVADCNLATVSHMALLKSRKKSEFERQISIAQHIVDWMVRFGIDPTGTRAEDVIRDFGGSVQRWAESHMER